MASALKGLSNYDFKSVPSGENLEVAIVVADWNSEITFELLRGCVETLEKHGVASNDIRIEHVPGSFELPFIAKALLECSEMYDVIIVIGAIITGETRHDEYISHAVTKGIMELNLRSAIPIVFGVLTPNNMEQALDRAGGKHGNKGVEAAVTALKMAKVNSQFDYGFGDDFNLGDFIDFEDDDDPTPKLRKI